MSQEICFESRSALEALRSGVVNEAVVSKISYGRENVLHEILSQIEENPWGSTQQFIGGYGYGKSHVCELVACKLLSLGYGVAKLEMGASHGSAESPRSVLASIENNFQLHLNGARYHGDSDISFLLRTMTGKPRFRSLTEKKELARIYRQYPDNDQLHIRFNKARLKLSEIWSSYGSIPEMSLKLGIPGAMTATNYVCSRLTEFSHELYKVGAKGLVLILDEAERTDFSANSYREERALDWMLGIALTASNKRTGELKHFHNDYSFSYRKHTPSRIHVLNAFSYRGGNCSIIARRLKKQPIELREIGEEAHPQLIKKIMELYSDAYPGQSIVACENEMYEMVEAQSGDGLRQFVRSVVAALDSHRLQSKYNESFA